MNEITEIVFSIHYFLLPESHKAMHLQSGILIGVPIPEADVKSGEIIQQAIDSVIVQAMYLNIYWFIIYNIDKVKVWSLFNMHVSLYMDFMI